MTKREKGHKNLRPPWKPGQSPNPKGRPVGVRNRFCENFLIDLYNDWQAHGIGVLERVRDNDPSVYLRVVASLMPKRIESRNHYLIEMVQSMTDDELEQRIRDLDAESTALSAETRTH